LTFCRFQQRNSNTNGGVPGPLSDSKQLIENFFSAAIIVAYLSHPDFDGAVKYSAPHDGIPIAKGVEVYAPGLRNPFGVVFHSNGKLYATDSGPNLGFGRMMRGCGTNQDIDDQEVFDKLIYVQKGKYYGHPNKRRATYSNDLRQCVWRSYLELQSNSYEYPLIYVPSPQVGLVEFHGNHFGGQLRRNLIMTRYEVATEGLSRVVLNENGTSVSPESFIPISMGIGSHAIDTTQAPNGNLIEVRYKQNEIYSNRPVEPATTEVIVKTVFPHRGRNSGGNLLSIYGVNLNAHGSSPIVTVGEEYCLNVTFVSSTRIDCVVPGGFGTVDIVVTLGPTSSTFEQGYRYVSGVLPANFVLPTYDG
jgi:IPT/TIG domain/Glucose / Sorbosone dehydrogenase